jgi:hypothetical protein
MSIWHSHNGEGGGKREERKPNEVLLDFFEFLLPLISRYYIKIPTSSQFFSISLVLYEM